MIYIFHDNHFSLLYQHSTEAQSNQYWYLGRTPKSTSDVMIWVVGGHFNSIEIDWFDHCSCGFNKLKSYSDHTSGKHHGVVIAKSESVWFAYNNIGNTFYDPSISLKDATRAWSIDLFIDGLKARRRSSIKHVLAPGASSGQMIQPLCIAFFLL